MLLFTSERRLAEWLGTVSPGPKTGFYLPQTEGHPIPTWASWGRWIICGGMTLSPALDRDGKDPALHQRVGVLSVIRHTCSWLALSAQPRSVLPGLTGWGGSPPSVLGSDLCPVSFAETVAYSHIQPTCCWLRAYHGSNSVPCWCVVSQEALARGWEPLLRAARWQARPCPAGWTGGWLLMVGWLAFGFLVFSEIQ